jgi:hypothetical protein
MKFFSKFVLIYAAIVLLLTGFFYYLASKTPENSSASGWIAIAYAVLVFGSALFISIKEKYNGYAGFNYHFVTYIVCNGLPLVLAVTGVFNWKDISFLPSMAIFWGLGLAFHFAMYYFMFRKKMIRNYEKEDVFR